MMRKLSLMLACGLAAGALQAQESGPPMLDQGTKELGLSGTIEWPEFEEVDFDIDATYGYFFRDGWEVGGRVLGADIGGVERFDISVFTEYNFNRQSNTVPFIGASVGVAEVSFPESGAEFDTTIDFDDDEATVFSITGGVKWFLRPYMAISTAISFNVSTDDIY